MPKTPHHWTKELEALLTQPRWEAEGFAIQDLDGIAGHRTNWWRDRIREAINQGLAELSGFSTRERIDGHPCKVPMYKIKKKAK